VFLPDALPCARHILLPVAQCADSQANLTVRYIQSCRNISLFIALAVHVAVSCRLDVSLLNVRIGKNSATVLKMWKTRRRLQTTAGNKGKDEN